jgi:hypothetical protein
VPTLAVAPPLEADQRLPAEVAAVAELPASDVSQKPMPQGERTVQVILLVLLFSGAARMCLHGSCANDADIWWHLRVGEWIQQHRAVPHVDAFSGPLGGHPWLAYSWLFELIMVKLFQWRQLVGIAAYTTAMTLAITVAIYHMVRRLQSDFTISVLLTFFTVFSMGHLLTPRPWLLTILFFALELNILMHARKTGTMRGLIWLPFLFALWANIHIEFVDGLLVLGLAFAEAVATRWMKAAETRVRPLWLGFALLTSALATLVNPYGWRIYAVARDLATQSGALNKISELQAIPFRTLADFVILALALGSVAALARQKRILIFESGLLLFATVVSFRSQRDVWVVAIASAAILASCFTGKKKATNGLPASAIGLAALVSVMVVVTLFGLERVNNDTLEAQIVQNFPVRAVEVIRQRGYSGPLFNDFTWGGYLIWNLRLPVAIDGRQNLYGDQRMDRSTSTWSAEPGWELDPQLATAQIVIGPTNAALNQALRRNPHFQLAYQDEVATVFVTRK